MIGVDYSVKYPNEVKTLTAASTQCYSEVPIMELKRRKYLWSNFAPLQPQREAKMADWH